MTVSARKITAFAKLVAGLADTPNLGSTTLLKQWFDSSPEELRVAFNGLIDDLIATAAGASGTEQIGSAAISGVAGATAYAQLVDLKTQLNSAVMGSLTTETTSALTQKVGIINANFDVWQRGTSFSSPGYNAYAADRWQELGDGTRGTFTVSRQAFIIGQTDVPNNPKYFYRHDQTVAGSGQTFVNIQQKIENASLFAGSVVTVSFYAKADSARTINCGVWRNYGTGGTPSAQEQLGVNASISLTTVFKKFTLTFTATSVSGKTFGTNGDDYILLTIGLPINTTFTIDIAQAQMNIGGMALPYQPKSYNQELYDCMRYYEPLDFNALLTVIRSGTTSILGKYQFKVQKRIPPILANIGDLSVSLGTGSKQIAFNRVSDNLSITATGNVTLNADGSIFMTKNIGSIYFSAATSFSATAGDALYIVQTVKDTLIGFDAEL